MTRILVTRSRLEPLPGTHNEAAWFWGVLACVFAAIAVLVLIKYAGLANDISHTCSQVVNLDLSSLVPPCRRFQ